jgi:hypothetical protein
VDSEINEAAVSLGSSHMSEFCGPRSSSSFLLLLRRKKQSTKGKKKDKNKKEKPLYFSPVLVVGTFSACHWQNH